MTVKKLKERLACLSPDKTIRLDCDFGPFVTTIGVDFKKDCVVLAPKTSDDSIGSAYTVRHLLEALEGIDESFLVVLRHVAGNEGLFVSAFVNSPDTSVWLEDEEHSCLVEALPAIFKHAAEEQMDELDFYMDLLETGITVELVSKYMGRDQALHMKTFCIEHGLLDEFMFPKKKLVVISSTSDAFGPDDYHFVLRDSLDNICTKNDSIIGLYGADLERGAFAYKTQNTNIITKNMLQEVCGENNFLLIESSTMEELEGYGCRILYDENLIDYFLGQKQDYLSEYWSNGIRKELYLKAFFYGMDTIGADGYVHCYDLLGTDVGIEKYFDICAMLEENGYGDIAEADKDTETDAWKVMKENLYTSNGKYFTLNDVKDYWGRHSFVCYNDKDFFKWIETQTVFKKFEG